MSDKTCQPCPGNTVMDQEAAAQCECLDGYFRNDENRVTDSGAQALLSPANEQPSTPCTRKLYISTIINLSATIFFLYNYTEPPSAPGDIMLTVQDTNITAEWSSPASTGGRSDLYYQVEHSDPDNPGTYTGTVYLSGGSINHTFTGLRPDTQYCVRVIADNGVSDQDPDGTHLRTVQVCTRTERKSLI